MNKKILFTFAAVLIAVAGLSFWVGGVLKESSTAPEAAHEEHQATTYYCSMHPHITLPHPGKCSICGMDLIPMTGGSADLGPRTLKLSEGAMQLAEIETEKVKREFVVSVVAMVGKVEFDETAVKTITAWVPGRLDRLYVDYTGVPIAKGDHLADVYSPKLYEAQQQLFEALKSVEGSNSNSERLRESSTRTLEAVRKKLLLLGLSEKQVEDIEKRKTLSDRIQISSTVGGVVVEKLANEGDYVQTGTPLYKVVALEKLWVKLDAYESDLPWLRYGQEVSFHTEAYPGETFTGKVSFIDWVVDHHTRTIKLRLNVDNTDGRLKPGMFVRAEAESTLTDGGRVMSPALAGKWISPMHPEIVKDAPGSCDICGMDLVPAETLFRTAGRSTVPPLVVPASAPLVTGRRAVVYVKKPGTTSTFEGREIVLGPRAGEHYVVLSGLEEGEDVVTRGNFKIDSSLQIEAKPSMMNPQGGGGGGGHDHGGGNSPKKHAPGMAAMKRLSVPASFQQSLDNMFGAYLKVSAALVEGKLESAESSFAHLGNLVEAFPGDSLDEEATAEWKGVARSIRNAVVLASTSKNLKEIRNSFSDLTKPIIHAEHRFGHTSGTLYETFCPMALGGEGASWLQTSKDIQNPYYGASMLTCGEVRQEFQAVALLTPAPGAVSKAVEAVEAVASEPDAGSILTEFYPHYLAMGEALSGDAPKKAADAARSGGDFLSRFPKSANQPWARAQTTLAASLGVFAKTNSIEEQRQAFASLSNSLREAFKEFQHSSVAPVNEFFCPMAFDGEGAFWLQAGDKTRNPYFGASMLGCGSKKSSYPAVTGSDDVKTEGTHGHE